MDEPDEIEPVPLGLPDDVVPLEPCALPEAVEPGVPELMLPEDIVPEPVVPDEPLEPEDIVPEPGVPELVLPEDIVPEPVVPDEPLEPEDIVPEPVEPDEPLEPEDSVPEPWDPEPVVPDRLPELVDPVLLLEPLPDDGVDDPLVVSEVEPLPVPGEALGVELPDAVAACACWLQKS